MRDVRRRFVWAVCAALIVGGVWMGIWVKSLSTPSVPAHYGDPIAPSLVLDLTPHIQAGDVIFRGRDKSWGDLAAQISDRDQRYGHVGVVVKGEAGWEVVDAAGHPLAKEAVVTRAPLRDFLYYSDRAGLYRPDLTDAGLRVYLDTITGHAAAQTPFDGDFSLNNQTKVYCTELVWDALNRATGRDAVEDHTKWRGKRVIAIDDLQYAGVMSEVANVTARALEPET
jgi:hypothetical protein